MAFAGSFGPASADTSSFDPARVDGGPGCAGTVSASASPQQGQQGGDHATFFDSSVQVQVSFKADAADNPLGSASSSPAGTDCSIPATVTATNLDTGVTATATQSTHYDGHYGWNATFFSFPGSGRVSIQVSTNPSPAELIVDVPAPR
ncbi:hypothetical protein D7D52_01775 [Nocardia yunnanensis]|uniref:Uncharacterized protein n=1 Tax=Nocardia yunnanensis TaxID=2382165 RepID=A0A386Z6S1_9NOCA|nr:hypothetical protein D7D52_01775 [Nocardia yunnanensis]